MTIVLAALRRAKLYRWGEDVKGEKCWKDRGTGQLKLLKHHDTGKIRVLLRVDKTKKIRLNHYLQASVELQVNPTSDRTWNYITNDFSDATPEMSSLAVKFKDPESELPSFRACPLDFYVRSSPLRVVM